MTDRNDEDLVPVYLKPGEFCIAERPTLVTTVLGSCVSVTMYSPSRSIGAICHGLLPNCRDDGPCTNECGNAFRYVDCSVKLMIDEFRKKGVPGRELLAKIFGGADMFSPSERRSRPATVGSQNISTAIDILKAEGIRVVKSDTGGDHGRKIIFNSQTGDVYLKRLRKVGKEA